MEEVVAVSLEDLKGLVESVPEDVIITVPMGKGEDVVWECEKNL